MDAFFSRHLAILLVVAGAPALPAAEQANPKTAFELVKLGNQHVAPHARDRVVQIRSERSEFGWVPTTWHIVYYDEHTALNAVELLFHDNRLEDSKKPLRITEPIRGTDKEIPARRRKIDSDKVLEIVRQRPELKDVKVEATQMWLKWEQGQPVWKVRLWAEHYFDKKSVEIGDIYVAPDTGEVMLVDLKLKRLSKRGLNLF